MKPGLRTRGVLGLALGAVAWVSAAPTSVGAQAVSASRPAASVQPPAPDIQELLVEVRIGRLLSRTMPALTDGSEILLPVAELLEMVEVDQEVSPAGGIRAVLHPGARSVTIDPETRTATLRGTPVPVGQGETAVFQGVLYASTSLIEELLDLRILVDWTELSVVVADPEGLPVGRRLEREARWRSLTGGALLTDPDARLDVAAGRIGGAVLDWSLSTDLDAPYESSAYAVGAGARLLGGGLQASLRSVGAASLGERHLDVTYQTVFQDLGWLTQMRLGDGFSTGPRLRSVRGASLTNAPFMRRSFFGVDAFAGRVGPGWDVELRQTDRAVDYTRADEQGAFALDIPLRYGENAVQVVAFGPHGEVVTTERLVLLDLARLTGGSFEWGLSGGACRDQRCDFSGNLDLRYGLSDRWTLRGGTESFVRDTLPSLVQPYVGITGSVLPGLEISSEALHDGFLRGGLTFAPSTRFRGRAAFTAFDSDVPEPILHDGRRRTTTEADVLLRPLAGRSRWLLRSSLLRQDFDFGTLSRIQAASTFQVRNTSVEVGIRREVDVLDLGTRWVRDFQLASVTGLISLPGQHKLWARSEIEFVGASALERVRGRLAYQLGPSARLELGGGWRRGIGADLTVTLSAYLTQLRSLTQLVVPEGGPSRVTQVSQGTAHWNEATRRVSFSAGPGLERGGISGYVFLDENGNGVRDPGENGVEGVRVVIGGKAVRSDALGRHEAWDLVPFQPVRVWADSTSIRDPLLVPLRDQVEVVVPPSSFGRVDVPITPSKELWGRVVRVTPQGEVPLPHFELELLDLRTGAVRRIRAYSDGEFYEIGVKPGRYELRPRSQALGALGLRAESDAHALEIQAGMGTGPLEPIVIRLVDADPGGGELR